MSGHPAGNTDAYYGRDDDPEWEDWTDVPEPPEPDEAWMPPRSGRKPQAYPHCGGGRCFQRSDVLAAIDPLISAAEGLCNRVGHTYDYHHDGFPLLQSLRYELAQIAKWRAELEDL